MDEQRSPPVQPPTLQYARPTPNPSAGADHLQPNVIIADVGIIFALRFAAGVVLGAATAAFESVGDFVLVALATSFTVATAGFTLSGLRAPHGNRWPHLLWVALGVWLSGLIDVLLGLHVVAWMFSSIAVAAAMAIGGAIVTVIRR